MSNRNHSGIHQNRVHTKSIRNVKKYTPEKWQSPKPKDGNNKIKRALFARVNDKENILESRKNMKNHNAKTIPPDRSTQLSNKSWSKIDNFLVALIPFRHLVYKVILIFLHEWWRNPWVNIILRISFTLLLSTDSLPKGIFVPLIDSFHILIATKTSLRSQLPRL